LQKGVGEIESKQTRRGFQDKSEIRVSVQMLHFHRLQLAVDRFKAFAAVCQVVIVRSGMSAMFLRWTERGQTPVAAKTLAASRSEM
jgi:hypothetical protein